MSRYSVYLALPFQLVPADIQYLEKPFTMQKLLLKVGDVLRP